MFCNFEGNFSDAQISLYNNNLTTFDSCVFKTMLEQMSASTGYLEVGGSKKLSKKILTFQFNKILTFSNHV